MFALILAVTMVEQTICFQQLCIWKQFLLEQIVYVLCFNHQPEFLASVGLRGMIQNNVDFSRSRRSTRSDKEHS